MTHKKGDKMSNGGESLVGRRAVVTGASRGIGQSIALALAQAGADVVVTARGGAELEQVAAQIRALERRSLAVPCDVTDSSQVEQLALFTREFLGRVDILVNNAGGGESHKFLNHPDDLWHRMLTLNLTSVYYVTKAFVSTMVEQRWGRIINIASIAAKTGARYVAAYTAAKHGVLGLTRALAAELVSYQITVNAVCPGYVDTLMTQATVDNIVARTGLTEAQARETLEKMSPQQRLITPEEVAAVTIFLAQDSSYGITGQAINVDGGMVMF
jgi:NAD(P)-dependent dehydrogenase (short-subunit alcohol dehydrogenase family)